MARSKARTSIFPLAYKGAEPITPLQFTVQTRNPTNDDYDNWNIGAIWLNETPDGADRPVWMLVGKLANVATWIQFNSVTGVQTLTGDTGGAIGPDAAFNIDVPTSFSPLSLDGNAGTFTITLNEDGTLATTYATDGGNATPASSILIISGGDGIATSGTGSTITVQTAGDVPVQYDTDSGSAIPVAGVLQVLGGSDIDTSGAGDTVTIAREAEISIQYDTDAGSAVPAANILEILGGLNRNTSGAGNTVTINMNNLGGPGAVVTDGSGVMSSINGTDGQVLIAGTGLDPIWADITSSDGTIILTQGPNSLDLSAPGGSLIVGGENMNITSPATANLNRVIRWPNTDAGGTEGIIHLGSTCGSGSCTGGFRWTHNYGNSTIADQNTFMGREVGNLSLNTSLALRNTGVGGQNLSALTTGSDNTAIGVQNLWRLTTGSNNTSLGEQSLRDVVTGNNNTSMGHTSLWHVTGSDNVGIGREAGENFTSGSNNIIAGVSGGALRPKRNGNNYTTTDSDNISIYNIGVSGDNNTIRIGTDGSSLAQQDTCYIAGIYGRISTGGTATLINSSHLLGTTTSSERYKTNVEDILDSEKIYDLDPVSFNYRDDKKKRKEFGLIAEEVENVFPELVVYDQDGLPFTVQYEKLVTLILSELKNLSSRLDELESQHAI